MAFLNLRDRVLEGRIGYLSLEGVQPRLHIDTLASEPRCKPNLTERGLVVRPDNVPQVSGCDVRFTLLDAEDAQASQLDAVVVLSTRTEQEILPLVARFGDVPLVVVEASREPLAVLADAIDRSVARMKAPRSAPLDSSARETPTPTTRPPSSTQPPSAEPVPTPVDATSPSTPDDERPSVIAALRQDVEQLRAQVQHLSNVLGRVRDALA